MRSQHDWLLIVLVLLGLISYGLLAVLRFAWGSVRRAPDGSLGIEAVVHIIFWTIVPPLWFGFVMVALSRRMEELLIGLSPAPFCLAILIAILGLVREARQEPR